MKPTLIDVVYALRPDATPALDWKVQGDGEKAEIVSWNEGKLGPAPTKEELTVKRAELTRANIVKRIEARRAQAEETGSVTIGEIVFGTSSSSRLGVIEAVTFSQPGDTIRFKDASGTIRKLSREDLVALGGKLLQHLEEVRATQEKLDTELLASSDAELTDFAEKVEAFAVENAQVKK